MVASTSLALGSLVPSFHAPSPGAVPRATTAATTMSMMAPTDSDRSDRFGTCQVLACSQALDWCQPLVSEPQGDGGGGVPLSSDLCQAFGAICSTPGTGH